METALAHARPTDPTEVLKSELGPVTRAVAERYFAPVRFSPEAEERLRTLHETGFVVHVMRSTAWVNFLYLTWALVKRGLPAVRAVVNLRPWWTRPWRHTAQRGELDVRFTYARRQGGSGLLFLRRTRLGRAHGTECAEDPFPALVRMARRSDRTVWLVPELFVWEKWSARLKPVWADYVFGSPEAPGFLHSLMAFWRNYRRAQFRVGEPIDLKRFIEQNPEDSDERLARKVRTALNHHLARETRAVFGPPFKPAERLIEETLRDRGLRRTLEDHAAESGRRPAGLLREARRNLRAIAARVHPMWVGVAAGLFNIVFERIYDGVEVDEAGLERAMRLAARAPLVLCPSHKSHVDYLVLSWALWRRGYNVPVIAAGANLSFFPLGPFLRRCGAFFLRRSFKGDKVYTATFKAYIRKLVHDGVHQEFFPEGGRSRTGKLLQPKLGMLTWEVEAVLEGARNDLYFVPVSIDYEKVVEGGSYSRELAGGEKKPEDLKALLTAPKILTEHYGRVHLTFDEPVSLREFMDSRGLPDTSSVDEDQKRGLVQSLGHRVMYGISRVSTVTPHALVAAALLAQRGRGVSARDLGERISLLRRIASDEGNPVSVTLRNAPSDPTVLGAMQDAMRAFSADGMVRTETLDGDLVFMAEVERRAELAFYKNNLMNLVAPRALVASALLVDAPAPLEAVKSRALYLSRLFKREFIYQVGASFDVIFSDTLEKLERMGLVERRDDMVQVAKASHAPRELRFVADLLRDFLESYLLAALTLEDAARSGGLEKRAFVKAAQETGRAELGAGRIQTAESLGRTTLENAVALLVDQRWLVEEDRKLRPGPAALTAEDRAQRVEEIRRFLTA
ncbi:MAG: 1-acyl-sn-glycerol-3-phosphate acyltransferase [Myxococcaceae bacterium]|nr:1-acyl-sn-glycerol-3-phosphate acyltransferase [Myxococcaceae bacterium]MCI0673504.1 1-acyl-sn-glycerol-3-phosphate acyltransferase [Myxococcaceae bacterium]